MGPETEQAQIAELLGPWDHGGLAGAGDVGLKS